jgi:DNA-binding NarL/FixJ family response regulator
MKTVFVVGSDVFVVNSMHFALRYASGVSVFGVPDSAADVRQAVRDAEPHIVIIDGRCGPPQAVERLHDVRDERPEALLVLVSDALDDELLAAAGDTGALVCVSTSGLVPQLQALLAADDDRGTEQVALLARPGNGVPMLREEPPPDAGEACPLTKRELEILHAVTEGHTNARIGRDLWVTEQTVKFHLSNIYRKLGVANRTQASRYALVNDVFGARRRTPGSVGANGNGHRVLQPAAR